MSPYDVTPDPAPLDAAANSADDQLVERLRSSLTPDAEVVWGDDDDRDAALALLRALLLDVSTDLPPAAAAILPAGVTLLLPRRRRLTRGVTVAAVAAGVLSIGGVAAASAPGQPLAGVRASVSAAVTTVVNAFTPDAPTLPVPGHTGRPTDRPSPPGDAVSDAARSAAAGRQVRDNLDRAAVFLAHGRYAAAQEQLRAAARKLPLVTDVDEHAKLATQLAALESRLAAARSGRGHGTSREQPSPGSTHDGRSSQGRSGSSSDSGGQVSGGGTTQHTPDAVPTRDARSGRAGRAAG